jgi:hypothetical protein
VYFSYLHCECRRLRFDFGETLGISFEPVVACSSAVVANSAPRSGASAPDLKALGEPGGVPPVFIDFALLALEENL